MAARAKPFGGRGNKPQRGPRLGATGVIGPKGELTVLASGSRGAVNSPDVAMKLGTFRGLHLIVNVTAGSGFSLTFTLQGKDPITGVYYTILASAALVATGTTVLRVYPGLTAAANLTANDVLPDTWRVVVAGTGTATFSITAQMIP